MTDAQQKQPKHVMMMAAGTGGHVFPALAVAKDLQQQGIQVSWLATPAGMENRLLKNQNIPIYQIDIRDDINSKTWIYTKQGFAEAAEKIPKNEAA